MLDTQLGAFVRRLFLLAALVGFGAAAALAHEAPLATPPAAFVFAGLITAYAFFQDWLIGHVRAEAEKIKEKAAGANELIGRIVELCADHLDPRK